MLNAEFDIAECFLQQAIDENYLADETLTVERILKEAEISPVLVKHIQQGAASLITKVREQKSQKGLEAFLIQYDLTTEEGIALMCLAESLLRVPDKETIDRLIRDKIANGDWRSHFGKSPSLFVNATTLGLMALKRLSKGGEPVLRQAVISAMKMLSKHFVMGRTIGEALERAQKREAKGYRYSYDMLGEAAFTAQDAQKYFDAYAMAIDTVGKASIGKNAINGPGVSVKLSAIHPRFVIAKKSRLQQELYPRLKSLVLKAKEANIGITIDAEESHTLMITLELFQQLIEENILQKWQGLGLAVQAYQKRAPFVIDWLISLAQKHQQPIMVRLVKGAYWDTEIKLAQVQGLSGYPVFTRKASTDLNTIVCAKKLLVATNFIYPQFATHNALTVATIKALAKENKVIDYEFQCLHGMGEALYDQIVNQKEGSVPVRIYAPVGTHEDLLAYLVRRLLENGANTSFVNHLANDNIAIDKLIAFPDHLLRTLKQIPHPKIPLPSQLFEPTRANSLGVNLHHPPEFLPLLKEIEQLGLKEQLAAPTGQTKLTGLEAVKRYSPIHRQHTLGTVYLATKEITLEALTRAEKARVPWQNDWTTLQRAACLEKMATLLQAHRTEFYSLLIYEGGKTIDDAASEVREAIDYCYYYANQAKLHFANPAILPGPTGEYNQLSLHGRGIIACISPWNFPLAIFLGQVTACLASGSCVIAKPATQTPFIAAKAIALLHEAGIPQDVVQLLPGTGSVVGNTLVSDIRIKGVLFTGSTETARGINQKLSQRPGPLVPFVAETGGQNVMIVDSSALLEQVVPDVITSAFRSAGQRCSALRVLFVQEEIAEKLLKMLQGAVAELKIGDPAALSTDVGPVIDEAAKSQLHAHSAKMKERAKLLFELPLNQDCSQGAFFGPRVFEIPSLDILTEEVFGPILHVVRFKWKDLSEIISQINRTGYGLTMGIHSRINETVQTICKEVQVGNIYVNRNMIGAVVGVQPFGGEGLSGTGPKAGGPYYLPRLATERTLTINTTASGGNASLMTLHDEED